MRVYHFYFASLPWKEIHQNIQLSLFYTHTILIQRLCGRLSGVACRCSWDERAADDNVLSAFWIGWTRISAAFRDCSLITVTNWSQFSSKHFRGAVFYFIRYTHTSWSFLHSVISDYRNAHLHSQQWHWWWDVHSTHTCVREQICFL